MRDESDDDVPARRPARGPRHPPRRGARVGRRRAAAAPPGDAALAAEVEAATFRIVQEALTNVARYARPPAAIVSIHVTNGEAFVDVRDDGARRDGPIGHGSGITGMRERAALVGGRLEAGPDPDGIGWRVHAVLPRRRPARRGAPCDERAPRPPGGRPGGGAPRAAHDPRGRARHRGRRRGRRRHRGRRARASPGRPARAHGRPHAADGRHRGHTAPGPPRERPADRRPRRHHLRPRRGRVRRPARGRGRLPPQVRRARSADRGGPHGGPRPRADRARGDAAADRRVRREQPAPGGRRAALDPHAARARGPAPGRARALQRRARTRARPRGAARSRSTWRTCSPSSISAVARRRSCSRTSTASPGPAAEPHHADREGTWTQAGGRRSFGHPDSETWRWIPTWYAAASQRISSSSMSPGSRRRSRCR